MKPSSGDIKFEINGAQKSIKIAPLLFLPLVENAFKHGASASNESVTIEIRLKIDEFSFIFISTGSDSPMEANDGFFSIDVNDSEEEMEAEAPNEVNSGGGVETV